MNAKKLLEVALSLSAEERADLAHSLLGSLDGPPQTDVEATWIAEIEKRAKDLGDGSIDPVNWAEARERIRRRMHEQRS